MAMSRLACVLGALVVVAACGSVSAHGNPVFPVPPVPSLNLTHVCQLLTLVPSLYYVESAIYKRAYWMYLLGVYCCCTGHASGVSVP